MTTRAGYSLTPPLPRELQVEVTGACNLRCRMCLVRYAPAVGRAEGALSFEDFRALVDALPRLTRLTLQGLGEPLLAPHLLDMVRYATDRSVEVGFNTNGVLLDRRWARDLVEAGAGWVHVSLDGATAATYEDVRHSTSFRPRRGQFDRVVGNLRALLAERAAAGVTRPVVKLVFVAMRRNVAELPDLVALAADLGVDELWVQNLSHTFSDTDPAGGYAGIREYAARESLEAEPDRFRGTFAAAAAVAAERDLAIRLPHLPDQPQAPARRPDRPTAHRPDSSAANRRPPEPDPPAAHRAEPPSGDRPGCTWPWQSAYVTHRGEVQPCCMVMGSDRATLGRLDGESFADIWHGERYREFRAALLTDRPAEVCRGCALYRGSF